MTTIRTGCRKNRNSSARFPGEKNAPEESLSRRIVDVRARVTIYESDTKQILPLNRLAVIYRSPRNLSLWTSCVLYVHTYDYTSDGVHQNHLRLLYTRYLMGDEVKRFRSLLSRQPSPSPPPVRPCDRGALTRTHSFITRATPVQRKVVRLRPLHERIFLYGSRTVFLPLFFFV